MRTLCPVDTYGVWSRESDALNFAKQFTSLEAAWDAAPRPDWMLQALSASVLCGVLESSFDSDLRAFACELARRVVKSSEEEICAARLIGIVEGCASGRSTAAEMRAQSDEVKPIVLGAALAGYDARVPLASAELACFHCADADAFDAAFWTTWFQIRNATDIVARSTARELDWPGDVATFAETAGSAVVRLLTETAQKTQSDLLRSSLENPFTGCMNRRRLPRNERGEPRTPDIAAAPFDHFGWLRPSEAYRVEIARRVPDEANVRRIVHSLIAMCDAEERESGRVQAYRRLMGGLSAILEAPDFETCLDSDAIEAHEEVRRQLFGDLEQ